MSNGMTQGGQPVPGEKKLSELAKMIEYMARMLVDLPDQVEVHEIAGENTLRGRFVRLMNERLAATADPLERERIERARLYGLEALAGREVRPR